MCRGNAKKLAFLLYGPARFNEAAAHVPRKPGMRGASISGIVSFNEAAAHVPRKRGRW